MENWWQRGIIYQIYARSFADTDADGIGDLRGIISRLDYPAALGVDAIWLSPIYPSPMCDFGYDVSDHTNVHPLFGAGVAAILLLTLRGTPTMYYGDELGMLDVKISPECIQDPFEKNVPGIGLGRDPCRTPMQWDGSNNAGFTSGTPWLPVDDDYPIVNVSAQSADQSSILTLYHRLITLRRQHAALAYGGYEPVAMTGDLLAY